MMSGNIIEFRNYIYTMSIESLPYEIIALIYEYFPLPFYLKDISSLSIVSTTMYNVHPKKLMSIWRSKYAICANIRRIEYHCLNITYILQNKHRYIVIKNCSFRVMSNKLIMYRLPMSSMESITRFGSNRGKLYVTNNNIRLYEEANNRFQSHLRDSFPSAEYYEKVCFDRWITNHSTLTKDIIKFYFECIINIKN